MSKLPTVPEPGASTDPLEDVLQAFRIGLAHQALDFHDRLVSRVQQVMEQETAEPPPATFPGFWQGSKERIAQASERFRTSHQPANRTDNTRDEQPPVVEITETTYRIVPSQGEEQNNV